MAWPYDAVYQAMSAGMELASALMNEIQERIVDLHKDHTICLYEAWSDFDTSGAQNYWEIDAATPSKGYETIATGGRLWYCFQSREGVVLKSMKVKYYNSDASPALPICTAFVDDMHFDVAATAPSFGTAVGTVAGNVASTAWGISSVTGLSAPVLAGQKLVVVVDALKVGDFCAGVQLTVQPLTMTP